MRHRHRFRHGAQRHLPKVALVGNPNVGKSLLFNRLSGAHTEVANYPGVTAEVFRSVIHDNEGDYMLVDLPGVYGLDALSEDQQSTWNYIFEEKPDLVVAVLDATNLSRNLFLLFVLMALDLPLLVVGTFGDQAEHEGEPVDWEKLSRLLELPVVSVVATRNQGIPQLKKEVRRLLNRTTMINYPLPYPANMRHLIPVLGEILEEAKLPPRRSVFLFLRGDARLKEELKKQGKLEKAQAALDLFRKSYQIQELIIPLYTFFHSLARFLGQAVQKPHQHFPRRMEKFLTAPMSGSFSALLILLSVFGILFLVGGWLSEGFTWLWTNTVSPGLEAFVRAIVGTNIVERVILWGLDQGIQAALAVGIPYILVFYVLLAFLEDSGYLSVLSFLGERLTRLFGLPGRALVNLVAGAGCNVPALIGTRILPGMRERFIASFLILLVPCSARTVVILGAAGPYLGWGAALSLYAITIGLVFLFGLLLNRVYRGQPTVMISEIPPMRWPQWNLVLKKTWTRFSDFLLFATPIMILGSLLLGTLYETHAIQGLLEPLRPFVEGWMGLPVVAGLVLIFSFLRKEMSLQLLFVLAAAETGRSTFDLLGLLSPVQLYVFVYFVTVSFPCLSSLTALARELKWKRALLIFLLLFGFSLLTSGLLYRLLLALGFS